MLDDGAWLDAEPGRKDLVDVEDWAEIRRLREHGCDPAEAPRSPPVIPKDGHFVMAIYTPTFTDPLPCN